MEKLFLIGDAHTVNAFRICGVEGIVADEENSGTVLKSLLAADDTLVVLITRECAEPLAEIIKRVNLESPLKVVIELPGIDDAGRAGKSLAGYITEALGVAL